MCSECKKGYSRQDRLRYHLKSEHGIHHSNHRKRFDCPICDNASSFHTFNQLKVHCESKHKQNLGKECSLRAACIHE